MEKLTADPQTGRVVWTREAFHKISHLGILSDGHHELLEGEILRIPMSDIRKYCAFKILSFSQTHFPEIYFRIYRNIPISPHSEPQPDIAVMVNPRHKYRKTEILAGNEFRLVIEVSDTTLWRDKGQKARLYAEAGVPEYWIVNLAGRTLIVHRNPVGGEYRSVETYDDTQSVAPQAAPEHTLAIGEILPALK